MSSTTAPTLNKHVMQNMQKIKHIKLRQRLVWFILLADECRVCRYNCEIHWERMPYLSTLEVCWWRGTTCILPYLTFRD